MKKVYQFIGKAEVIISATCFTISLLLIFSKLVSRFVAFSFRMGSFSERRCSNESQ